MKIASLLTCTIILSLSAAPLAWAETAATDAAKAAPADASKTSAADKKAKSKECIAEADAKGLHGKERKKFKHECKKGN